MMHSHLKKRRRANQLRNPNLVLKHLLQQSILSAATVLQTNPVMKMETQPVT